MAVNLSAISSAQTTALALANLILVSPQSNYGVQPQQKVLPDGSTTQLDPPILFNYEGENSVMLESDVTDHFVEDNTAIQDQVALRPELITTHGYIGELNDVVPPLLAPLKLIADKLTTISAFTPGLSATAVLAYAEAQQAYAIASLAISAGVSAWGAINGTGDAITFQNGNVFQRGVQNKQQIAFQQFYGYWRNRTLFTVQTPWALFENCVIKSLRSIQDAETRVFTDFEVTFKLMRFAQTITTGGLTGSFQGRGSNQAAKLIDNGASTGGPEQAFTDPLIA